MTQKTPRIEWMDNENFKIQNSEISLKPESFRGTDRPLSQLVKVLKTYSNKTSENICKCLGLKNTPCVDSKLNRGSFSVEDIVKIADYCGFDVVLRQRPIPEKLEKALHGKTPEEQLEIISWLREWLHTEYGFTKEVEMPEDNKLYDVELTYSADGMTTGHVHITKEQYEFLKWVADPNNWEKLEKEPYSGDLCVYCEELEDSK